MKVDQLKMGSFLSYAQMALGLIVGILYTPLMIRALGQSEYGLYNTVSSTISMLSLLSLGFGSGYIRYFARYKKENDQEAIYKLNGLFLLIFLVIGFVSLGCGLFLSENLTFVFAEGLTGEEYRIARILMLLLTFNLSVSFPMSVFVSIISAHERFVFLKMLGMLKTVVGPLVTLPLLLLGHKSIAMVLVTVGISLFTDLLYGYYVIKHLKMRFVFRHFPKGIFRQLFAYTAFIAINILVDQLNYNVGKILLGRFRGTGAVAIYSVGYTLYTYYMMFSTSVSGVFTPRVHRLIQETSVDSSTQRRALTELFTKVGRIQFLILGLIASGVIFFGRPFIAFWAGEGYEDSYLVAVLLMISASIPLMQNIGIEIQRAENRHQFRSLAYIVMAIINVVATVVLCQRFGAIGTAIGTSVSLLLANGLIMNIYYHKRCNIDILFFWRNILRVAVGLLPPIAVGILINRLFTVNSFLSLLLAAVVYAAVYALSMWLLGMNRYEKDLVRRPLQRLFRKKGAVV